MQDIFLSMAISAATTLATFIVNFLLTTKKPALKKTNALDGGDSDSVEAGRIFLDHEAARRRAEMISKIGAGIVQIGVMPLPGVTYLPRPRDELHELGVVNRLSDAQRARLKFEKEEQIYR